ncbi:MAG: hypothetical protein ACKOAD_06440 [Gammaproteobacteria bacterium]
MQFGSSLKLQKLISDLKNKSLSAMAEYSHASGLFHLELDLSSSPAVLQAPNLLELESLVCSFINFELLGQVA